MAHSSPRLLDHIVLPVENMKIARERYTRLGFTVAPEAVHTFGTENCCVYFENGSYIEPLAIAHRETVEENEITGNMFLRRDLGYRFRNEVPGFSKMAFLGNDADGDRESFKQAGYRTGEIVRVQRPGVDVRLAFAVDERSPNCTFFTCERKDGPAQFETELTTHENGGLRISRVVVVEENPSDFQYYIQNVSGQREIASLSFGMEFQLPNFELAALTPVGFEANYGFQPDYPVRGLRLAAFDVEVANLDKTREFLSSYSITFMQIGHRLVVLPATGLGAAVGFVQKED